MLPMSMVARNLCQFASNRSGLVAIDLKMEEFSPSFTGQLGFYLAVLDDKIKHPQDGSTIGLLLCKSRNRVVVEYALRNAEKPLGVADYTHSNALPAPEEWEKLLSQTGESQDEA